MKNFLKFIIFLLALLMALIIFYKNARADDWQLSTNLYKTIASDPESIVQSGYGAQISLHRKNLFIYLSKDIHQVRFAGQSCPDINLWSVGVGMQNKVSEYLTLSIDIGWYEPKFKEMGEPQSYPDSPFSEGLCRYLNKFLIPDNGYLAWDYYTLTYKGSIGGKIGLDFEYPITETVSFNMTSSYRYLKTQEKVQGKYWSNATSYWVIIHERDFSGWLIGGTLTYKF